ncbi:MAG: response regulator [Candidatus Goldiibacteriota bacterium]
MYEKETVDILLVEDNPGDVRLMVEGFKEGKISHEIHTVNDGEAAIDFLGRKEKYRHAAVPDLILLDLKIPRKNGFEVLEFINKQNELSETPVVVLTSSEAEEDILRAYELNANCYVTKPLDIDRYVVMIKSIEEFWITVIRNQ